MAESPTCHACRHYLVGATKPVLCDAWHAWAGHHWRVIQSMLGRTWQCRTALPALAWAAAMEQSPEAGQKHLVRIDLESTCHIR